jgi:hypothetical protein
MGPQTHSPEGLTHRTLMTSVRGFRQRDEAAQDAYQRLSKRFLCFTIKVDDPGIVTEPGRTASRRSSTGSSRHVGSKKPAELEVVLCTSVAAGWSSRFQLLDFTHYASESGRLSYPRPSFPCSSCFSPTTFCLPPSAAERHSTTETAFAKKCFPAAAAADRMESYTTWRGKKPAIDSLLIRR